MKKVVLSIFAFILFLGFWFTADYVAWCTDAWKIIWDGDISYNCKFCGWDMYNFDENKWWIDFYNRCCEWKGYTTKDWISASPKDKNKCCESGTEVSNNWVERVCETCNWERFVNADNWYRRDCCEWKKQLVAWWEWENWVEVCCPYWTAITWWSCISCEILETIPSWWESNCNAPTSNCDPAKRYTWANWTFLCCPGMLVPDDNDSTKKVCIINTEWNLGINMNSQCLKNWQCSYNIYKTLGIRKSDQDPQVKTFVQDIVLAVTMFLGTAIAIILVTSGILYILAAILWKSSLADTAKKGIINSILWLVLVTWSYALVRLVQFVATAWWW